MRQGGRLVDVIYLIVIASLWIALLGMAKGCDKLKGPKP
jgi:hypothetical protein